MHCLPFSTLNSLTPDCLPYFSYKLEQVHLTTLVPASMAQLDARPTGDQEIAGSTPAEVCNILFWRLILKYFLQSFSPFC